MPPAAPDDLSACLPDPVTWYDAEKQAFTDPCELLSRRDRQTLIARLRACGSIAHAVRSFIEELLAQDERVCTQALDPASDAWETAVKAVLGLAPLIRDEQLTAQEVWYLDAPLSPVLTALEISTPESADHTRHTVYRWRGVPFARSHAELGLEPLSGETLDVLRPELDRLARCSRRWDGELAELLGAYLLSQGSLLPETRERMLGWQRDARALSALPAEPLRLQAPWDDRSPSVGTLLEESLGESMRQAALRPFSDKLCLIPGASLGDAACQLRCQIPGDGEILTAIPPIGDALAEYLARFAWTGRGLRPDGIRLQVTEDGILAELRLLGDGEVVVSRLYGPDDILMLSEREQPQISLFPSVPVEHGLWKLYHVSLRGDLDVRLLKGGVWTAFERPVPDDAPAEPEEAAPAELGEAAPEEEPTDASGEAAPAEGAVPAEPPFVPPVSRVIRTDELPACLSVWKDGACLGALMYQAPIFHPPEKGQAVAAIDLGASGTAMALSIGGEPQPVSMPCLWHVLLRPSWDDPAGEALPVWPLGPVLPSAVQLLREGEGTEPLLDGRVCLAQSLDEVAVREAPVVYDLLWRNDPEALRARKLLLREAMLLCAFHAVMCGARSISWRMTLPANMAHEGARRLQSDMALAAAELARESGLPQTPGAEVLSLRQTMSIGMYLRDTVGVRSFVLLDLGGSGTSVSLWLRGMQRPAFEQDLGRGVSTILMQELLHDPMLLERDFAPLGLAPGLLRSHGEAGMSAWSRNRLMLDQLIGARLDQTAPMMDAMFRQARMTRTQAALTFHFCQMMVVAGMAVEAALHDSSLNDLLPQELPLCLCGRGSLVLERLDPLLRGCLGEFIRLPMSPEHPVRYVTMAESGAFKLEGVLGLCSLRALPDRIGTMAAPSVAAKGSLLELTIRFIGLLMARCPGVVLSLFPGMFTPNGMYSEEAQRVITAACGQAAPTAERFSVCLSQILDAYAAGPTEGA